MKLALEKFPLMGGVIPQRFLQIFANQGVEARFVGGCVRDALLGIAAQDIDIAIPLGPDEIVRILQDAHIKVIPTGYAFGTVTAVMENHVFQVTALRQDWQTDGRYARVIYGQDWHTDAARRDFTINALYADKEGAIFDYFGGIAHLQAGKICFVGKAFERIQEDYLRILRYFRFLAWYGHGSVDQEAMEACYHLKEGVEGLSRERVGHEFLKLLAAPHPLSSLEHMNEICVSSFVLPTPFNLKVLKEVLCLEEKPKALRRLAALSLPQIQVADLAKTLRLSKAQQQYLQSCCERLEDYPSTEKTLYRNLYYDHEDLFKDLTILSLSMRSLSSTPSILRKTFQIVSSWQRPVFPVQGKDLMSLGMRSGPKIGEFLKACETWWIDELFHPNKEDCLHWIQSREQFLENQVTNSI